MSQVKVILREEVRSLGQAGELVSVKPGFARNFLVPQGKAILATKSRVAELEHHRRVIEDNLAKELKDLEALKNKIQSLSLETTAKAGEEGKLFGSVTSQDIAGLMADKGVEIDRRKIALDASIKELGDHSIEIRLHSQVTATVKLAITAEE